MAITLSKNGKRLGRPPKGETKINTFIVDTPKFQVSEDMIECSFVPINEYSHVHSDNKKFGRYAQSTYCLTKYGKSTYVVLAYLQTDLEKYRRDGISDEQIVQRCVNYLNQEHKKKKPYGNLQLYGFRTIQKSGKEVVCIELVTDMRTNENFWGTGNR